MDLKLYLEDNTDGRELQELPKLAAGVVTFNLLIHGDTTVKLLCDWISHIGKKYLDLITFNIFFYGRIPEDSLEVIKYQMITTISSLGHIGAFQGSIHPYLSPEIMHAFVRSGAKIRALAFVLDSDEQMKQEFRNVMASSQSQAIERLYIPRLENSMAGCEINRFLTPALSISVLGTLR